MCSWWREWKDVVIFLEGEGTGLEWFYWSKTCQFSNLDNFGVVIKVRKRGCAAGAGSN